MALYRNVEILDYELANEQEAPPSGETAQQILVSGAFRDVTASYVLVGGAWKTVTARSVLVGGSWKTVE